MDQDAKSGFVGLGRTTETSIPEEPYTRKQHAEIRAGRGLVTALSVAMPDRMQVIQQHSRRVAYERHKVLSFRDVSGGNSTAR